MNDLLTCGVNKSQFHDKRNIAGVLEQIDTYHNLRIDVYSGSPVTIISFDLWKQIKYPKEIVNK